MAEQLAFNMDCMTAMRQMPDKAFDLAIVDPPYGINITNSHSVQVEREREREQQSGEAAHSVERRTLIGGGNLTGKGLSCPKAITLLMTKDHQMQNIFLRSKE